MTEPETVLAWECVGCGKLERTGSCVGICQDRRVELVYAKDHADALLRIEELEEILARIAHVTPRQGQWEATYRALQAEARRALALKDGTRIKAGTTETSEHTEESPP